MVTQAPKRSAIAVAIAFTLSCVGLIIFVWTQFGGTIPFAARGYEVKAEFAETGLLVPGADVRIAGVNIGRVIRVRNEGIDSLVTMSIGQQYAPIPRDTRAILREKTLLGEAYIELSNGSGRKLPDGGTIPRSQVLQAQQLDQVLDSFTPRTQHDLQTLLIGFGQALNGQGENLNDAFGNLDPAVTELDAVVGVLNAQSGNLHALLSHGAGVLGTVAARGQALQTLITAGDSVLSTTAARNRALTATVDATPRFLTQLRRTLNILGTTLDIARPSLAALEPVTPLLVPAIRGLVDLAPSVEALLRQSPPVLRTAERALPDLAAFAREFRPAVDGLLPAAEQLVPVIDVVAQYRAELTAGMANLQAILQGRLPGTGSDRIVPAGTTSYLRSLTTLGPDSLFGQSVREPSLRSNTYFSPGELLKLKTNHLGAATCSNTSNTSQFPIDSFNTACRLQPQYPFKPGRKKAYYPHVTKARP